MLPNSRNNTFQFNFPRTFMPKEISDKYKGYINKLPTVIDDPLDFLNYTIQSVNLPGMGFDAVEQQQKPGRDIQFRSTVPTQELFDKELNITFQLVDGYINYWMMLDILNYYYNFDNKNPYIDDLNLRMLDGEGFAIVTATMRRPLVKNISELSMSFASNVAEFNTFDVTIGYNDLEVRIELD